MNFICSMANKQFRESKKTTVCSFPKKHFFCGFQCLKVFLIGVWMTFWLIWVSFQYLALPAIYPWQPTANSKLQDIQGKYLGEEMNCSKISNMPAVVKISSLLYICWMIWECHTDVTMVKQREFLLPNCQSMIKGALDEDVSGWSCPKSYRKLLSVQGESDEWCSQGPYRSLLFLMALTVRHRAPSASVEMMWWHSWHTVGRGWHPEEPDWLEEWAQGNLISSNKAKYKVQHLAWSNPQYHNRLGDEWTESSPTEKDLEYGVFIQSVDKQLDISQQCLYTAQKGNRILRESKEAWPHWGRWWVQFWAW